MQCFGCECQPLPSLREVLLADCKSFVDVSLQLEVSSLVVNVSKFLVVAERGSRLRFSKACLVVAVNKFGVALRRPQSTPVGLDDDSYQAWVVEAVGETEAQPEGLQTRLHLCMFLCRLVVVRLREPEQPQGHLPDQEELSLQLTVGSGRLQLLRQHSSQQPVQEVCYKPLLQH